MKKVLFICPTNGNGGIQSWTRKMLQTFSNDEFSLFHVDVSFRRSVLNHHSGILRRIDGLMDLLDVYWRTKKAIKTNTFALMHTTTSGSIGTLRDYVLVKLCHSHNIPCVMHCRYGCITEDFDNKSLQGKLLRKTMHLYDNIWVLDKRSESTLKKDPILSSKVFLTPNSIAVPDQCDLSPKQYNKIAFVGNLIPSKGLYELIHAVTDFDIDVSLSIVGPGKQEIIDTIKGIAGQHWGGKVKYLGKFTNPEAVELIKSVDIICLASYYPSEAFPISIIESMSYGKFVIGTRRAAIPDMLTDLDGNECGYLVREKSVDDIVEAIRWCQMNPLEADARCSKAYEKVKACYSVDVVYKLYRTLYKNAT